MSIRRLDRLELRELNILIGPNGAGKSNFVAYFRLLRELVERLLQNWVSERDGSDRILSYGVKETSRFRSHIGTGASQIQLLWRQKNSDYLFCPANYRMVQFVLSV